MAFFYYFSYNVLMKLLALFCFIMSVNNVNLAYASETYLLDVRQGSALSDKIKEYRDDSYETALGEQVSFKPWYSTSWTDMRVLWLTQYTDHFGVIWGGSTGEKGRKYTIDPALTLGFIIQHPLSKNAKISIRVQGVIGGKLREKTCQADYGDIGGVQTVNCRLAATLLKPEETLQYLIHERPQSDNSAMIQWTYSF